MQCSLDIVDFYRASSDPRALPWGKLENLVEMFDSQRTSWLTYARQTDVEAYRAARDAGLLSKGKPKTDTFEMGTTEQQLAAIYELMQQLVHVSAHQKGQPKVRPWPRPKTAADLVAYEDAKQGYDDLMADIVFLPRDQWRAQLEAHVPE